MVKFAEYSEDKPTVGMPKSGKKWKKCSSKTDRGLGVKEKSWAKKEVERQKRDSRRAFCKSLKDKIDTERKEETERRKAKRKQKELNEFRSGKYQLIKNTANIKKWSRKQKQKHINLPSEIYYEKFG